MRNKFLVSITGFVFYSSILLAQDTAVHNHTLLEHINKKYNGLAYLLNKKSNKVFAQLQKQEQKLISKLSKLDTSKAKNLQISSSAAYQDLPTQLMKEKGNSVSAVRNYIPALDSIQAMMSFINGGNGVKSVAALQDQLQIANYTKTFLQNRKQALQVALAGTPLAKQLKQVQKTAFYYQQQIQSYRETLKDPDKLQKLALTQLSQLDAFKAFFAKNSQLANIFRMSGAENELDASSINGLQTRQSMRAALQQFESAGANPQQFVQGQVQSATGELQTFKNKLNNAVGGNGEAGMPSFKPNTQKAKSFLQRIELGFNIQSLRPNGLLPVTSDLAFTLGYKLNSQGVIGVGMSYKMGWGNGINNMRLTHEGFGLRSFVDWQIKGGFYISGGYEQNYLQSFSRLSELMNLPISAWKQSGLIGISKKYKLGKKKGTLQVLYDFLHFSNQVNTQPVIFRTGFNF